MKEISANNTKSFSLYHSIFRSIIKFSVPLAHIGIQFLMTKNVYNLFFIFLIYSILDLFLQLLFLWYFFFLILAFNLNNVGPFSQKMDKRYTKTCHISKGWFNMTSNRSVVILAGFFHPPFFNSTHDMQYIAWRSRIPCMPPLSLNSRGPSRKFNDKYKLCVRLIMRSNT